MRQLAEIGEPAHSQNFGASSLVSRNRGGKPMRRCRAAVLFGCISFELITVLGAPTPARALEVCGADQFPCPGTGVCVVVGGWSVGDSCILDFGDREVEVRGTLQSAVVGGSFGVRSGALRVAGGKLRAEGDAAVPAGTIEIQTTGLFWMGGGGAGAALEASGGAGGGRVSIAAQGLHIEAGVITVDGGVGEACGDAGSISLDAGTGTVAVAASVRAKTAGRDCTGGEISLRGGAVSVAGSLDASGGAGASDDAISVRALTGDVSIAASAALRANGTGQPDGVGSDAGSVEVVADAGDVIAAAPIEAIGKSPEGAGGAVRVAGRNVSLLGRVVASGGSDGVGGDVRLEAAGELVVRDEIVARGGEGAIFGQAGSVILSAAGDVDVESLVDVSGASGGEANVKAAGAVLIAGALVARGVRTRAGVVSIVGCVVEIAGQLRSDGVSGAESGFVNVAAGSVLVHASSNLSATPCVQGGCLVLNTPSGSVTRDAAAIIVPSPVLQVTPALEVCL